MDLAVIVRGGVVEVVCSETPQPDITLIDYDIDGAENITRFDGKPAIVSKLDLRIDAAFLRRAKALRPSAP